MKHKYKIGSMVNFEIGINGIVLTGFVKEFGMAGTKQKYIIKGTNGIWYGVWGFRIRNMHDG